MCTAAGLDLLHKASIGVTKWGLMLCYAIARDFATQELVQDCSMLL